jgi:hypothetical protein
MSRHVPNEFLRFIAITALLVLMGAAFAFAAGWLTPDGVESNAIVDSLEVPAIHRGAAAPSTGEPIFAKAACAAACASSVHRPDPSFR